MTTPPRTLFEKIWSDHVVHKQDDGTCLIYIDRHLVHEVTSPQAFEGLRMAGRDVRRLGNTLAVMDHNVPTTDRSKGIAEPDSRIQIETLRKNCEEFAKFYELFPPGGMLTLPSSSDRLQTAREDQIRGRRPSRPG